MDPAALILSLALVTPAAPPPAPAPCVGCATIEQLLAAERYFDAHTLALAHLAHPENAGPRTQVRLLLLCVQAQSGLGDTSGVGFYLDLAAARAQSVEDRERVAFLRAWTRRDDPDEPYLEIWAGGQRDPRVGAAWRVYQAILAEEPLPAEARLFAERGLLELAAAYEDRPRTYPLLAGVLNAFLPGAGYVYLGAWESALQTLVLNAAFIAAAIEFGLRDNVAPSVVSGLVGSFFYVGGIAGAVRGALEQDEADAARALGPIERLLFPLSADGSR